MSCSNCEYRNDAATLAYGGGQKPPEEGDVSICFRCGHIEIFTGVGVESRNPTAEEKAEVEADPDIVRAVKAVRRYWANAN